MPLYTVLAPPAPADSIEANPLQYVFVKDGFCWPALFFAVPWMLFRRLWLALVVYILIGAAAAYAGNELGGPLPPLFLLLWHLFFALEGNSFRRAKLRRRGYQLIGVAEGRRVGDAEVRFFHDRESPQRDPRQPPPGRMQAAVSGPTLRSRSPESGEVVGLFPVPGGTP
jgi:hypothetical protein